MEVEQIKETIISWESMLSKRMKKYIHYRSMRNFILHFNDVTNSKAQEKILTLLSEYVEEVKANDYDFEAESSYHLARKYLGNLSDYFREYSNFMRVLRIQNVFLWGILGDSLLYLAGFLSKIWYMPVVTIFLFSYYLFISIFKAPQRRVYGIFY
jgi:hypothetical protein